MGKLTQLKDKAVAFYQDKKRVVVAAAASVLAFVAVPAMADDVTFTPGSSAITSTMLDPVVKSITSTIATVSTAAFLVLGFGLSVYIGFSLIKGMFKTAAK